MKLYLGEIPISGISVYKDGNMPGFVSTKSGDMLYLSPDKLLEESPLTATAKQDIRDGAVAVTNEGIVTGEKVIPSYETRAGKRAIPVGSSFTIPLEHHDMYDYTDLQCIICELKTSFIDSIKDTKKVIDDIVYTSGSEIVESEISKNHTTKTIDLNIVNNTNKTQIIRYFLYKEID